MPKKIKIYMDHASAAPLDLRVLREMLKCLADNYANPGAIHTAGVLARQIIEDARIRVARILGAHSDEIIFTGSGTESNNLAISGLKTKHIVTTNIEHPSVLETVKKFKTTFVSVESNGVVDIKKISDAITKNTTLVSVMYANNEIGTIQPIRKIAKIIRTKRKEFGRATPYFHIDAVQATNYLPVNVQKLGVDMMTMNSSKIYGPKGVGILYKRRSIKLNPIIYGGGQEFGLRPGTENVAGIIGFAMALEITEKLKQKEIKRLTKLRDYFTARLNLARKDIVLNGDVKNRLPNNINISVPDFESELLVLELDARGIAISAKSACQAGEPGESYVIDAIKNRKGAVRFSLGRETSKKDIDYVLKALKDIFKKYKKWLALCEVEGV